MQTMASTAEKLRDLRRRRALTQQMLSDRSSVTQAAIARIERGQVTPHFSTLHKLAAALEVNPTDLLQD